MTEYELTNEDFIRAAMESGFQTHELSPSMRDFANRIAYDARQKLLAELQADGWRQCAKGQHTTQFCGQLEDAVKAERETCAQVCEKWDTAITDKIAASIRARGAT